MEKFNDSEFENEFGELAKKELDPRLGFVFKVEAMARKGDTESFRIKCFDKEGMVVGSTHIYKYPDHLKAAEVLVARHLRRQGIASAMYKQAEKYAKLKIVPSGVMTPDGKSLWGGMVKAEPLDKGLRGAIAGLALGASVMLPGGTGEGEFKPIYTAEDSPLNQEPETLHPHLEHIAHLESSGGKNVGHRAGPNSYWTAHGPLGIKPAFGHDEYKRSPELRARFPDLDKPDKFTNALKTYPAVYNAVANSAWKRLLTKFGTPQRAAYAWRLGEYKETQDRHAGLAQAYAKHPYVQHFSKLLSTPMQKSISDIAIPQGDDGRYDYSHVLPTELKDKGYRVFVDDGIDANGQVEVDATVKHHEADANHPFGLYVGRVAGYVSPNKKARLVISKIDEGHRDQGLGTAAYEAFLAHVSGKLGATHVAGGRHSTLSHAVHNKLADKHGVKYEAHATGGASKQQAHEATGAFDDAFDGYEYEIK